MVRIIKQKANPLKVEYSITDEGEKLLYTASTAGGLFSKKIVMKDLTGAEVLVVDKGGKGLSPIYTLSIGGELKAEYAKKTGFTSNSYNFQNTMWHRGGGDFQSKDYTLFDDERDAVEVVSKLLSLGDHYTLTIEEDQDELMAIGMVLLIDHAQQTEK